MAVGGEMCSSAGARTFPIFDFSYFVNYKIFRFYFSASHSKISNIIGGNSLDFFNLKFQIILKFKINS
jgi:hypothetical protein